ncbi:ATP-binding protein [Pelosinus sp. sgz500959]|uniref:ATP-binding protein n=1 Tax=Pelosinus sp. sgz500959 TaxID=3242472 RepID=UPI00366DF9D3
MEILRGIFRKNIAADLSAEQQSTGNSRFALVPPISHWWPIVLLVVCLISGLWFFVWYQINNEYTRSIEKASRDTMNLTKAFEEYVRRIVVEADKDLLSIKKTYERYGIASPLLAEYVADAATDPVRYQQVAVINEHGIAVISFIEKGIGSNVADREYYQVHKDLDTQEIYIGKPMFGRNLGGYTIPVSRRINKPDGSFGGVVVLGLRIKYFGDYYNMIDLGSDSTISLIGKDGIVRARQSNGEVSFNQDIRESNLWKYAVSSPYGTILGNNYLDKSARLASYRVMQDYPLIVTVGVSTQMALGNFSERKQGYILGALLTSLFILVIFGLLVDRVAKQRAMNQNLEDKVHELQMAGIKLNEQGKAIKRRMSDYQTLIENCPDSITRFNRNCESLYMNPESERRIERPMAFFVGKNIRDWGLPQNVWQEWESSINYVYNTGKKLDMEMEYGEDKTNTKYVRIIWVPELDEKGQVKTVLGISRDNTEQKQAQERFMQAFNINPHLMMIISLQDDTYIDINNSFLKAFGLTREEVVGQSVDLINIWDDPSERKTVEKELLNHGSISNYEIKYRDNNIMRSGLLSSEVIMLNNRPCNLHIITDITDKKQLESELARFDRLNLIGEMAASIGHEVRNPMTTVRGYLQWFNQKDAFVEYRESFAIMIDELDRANSIITDFLSLAKDKKVDLVLTDLNKIILNVFPLLQADAFRRGNNIELELQDTLEIFADEKEMRQCILNLVGNGLDSMSDGGQVTISTARIGNQVVMTVRDQGQGMTPEVKANLWTPFFTTKEHGTGLGLPVCFQIAQRHDATIEVETGPDGTEFHFIFNQKKMDS